MTGIDKERFVAALATAENGFWEKIAEAYPEATSGDLDPETADLLLAAMGRAVKEWLVNNFDLACRN